ncbi:MAG: hypothetical protein GY706_15285 [Bacteroides sp.]|nr:hypothetical protein [Bacteroides sp.]
MHLTEEQHKCIEDCAYRLISPSLIAINIEVDEIDFLIELRTPGTQVREYFYRGYMKQLIETREAIIKTAQNGSNPAQMELLKFFREVDNQLIYE